MVHGSLNHQEWRLWEERGYLGLWGYFVHSTNQGLEAEMRRV